MSVSRKFEWPFTGNVQKTKLWKLNSAIVSLIPFGLAKIWLSWPLSKKILYDGQAFRSLIEERRQEKKQAGRNSRPLLTFGNHRACIDDPLIWGALLSWRQVISEQRRWLLTAAELTFTNRFYSFMFGHGHCIPAVRGDGVYQRGVDFCIDRLNEGAWVHVYPEGKINLDDTRRLKWGIGRMIADSNMVPDIIPVWTTGADDILPNRRPYIPRIGQTLVVYVGKPIILEHLVNEWKAKISDPVLLRKQITDYIEVEFWKLKDVATAHHQQAINQCN